MEGHGTHYIIHSLVLIMFGILHNKKLLKALRRVHCEIRDLMSTQVDNDFFLKGIIFENKNVSPDPGAYVVFHSYGSFLFFFLCLQACTFQRSYSVIEYT